MKATKIDKRFARAWVILGHAFAALEESEHAVSAFRTAARLLPGDHRPLIYMAKELERTNSLPLALRLLQSALEIAPLDANVLNELGVACMRLGRIDEAISHLQMAVQLMQQQVSYHGTNGKTRNEFVAGGEQASFRKGMGEEILNNYATSLRRGGRIEESISWYQLCLASNPTSAGTYANLAFAYHLLQNFDEAVNFYHRALALQPTYSFCSDMLSRALKDSHTYNYRDSNNINTSLGFDARQTSFAPLSEDNKSGHEVSYSHDDGGLGNLSLSSIS